MRAIKEFTWFILNEDVSDIINLMKSLEDSNVLIDGITETAKDEVKKQEGRFLSSFLDSSAASFVHLAWR